MKKPVAAILFLSLTIISIYLMSGCGDGGLKSVCTGNIPSTASAGAPVTFASCASPSGLYSWNFGDGTLTVIGDTVTHIYAAAGIYTGTVTVTTSGAKASKSFTVTVINNSWTFKGGTYVTDSVVTSGGIVLSATGTSSGGRAILDLQFLSLPTSNGNYTVVNAANNNVGAGQVAVFLYSYTAGNIETIYGSTGSGTINAAVTVSNGKLQITLPTLEMVNQSNASDSTSLSASITQTQ